MNKAIVIGIIRRPTICANLGIGLASEGKEVLQLERQRQKAKSDIL